MTLLERAKNRIPNELSNLVTVRTNLILRAAGIETLKQLADADEVFFALQAGQLFRPLEFCQ